MTDFVIPRRARSRARPGETLNPATARAATDRRVRIVLDAMQEGDEATCARHGIDRRTLYAWRHRPEVQKAILEVVDDARLEWTDRIGAFMEEMIDTLLEKARRAEPGDLDKIAFAMKQITEVGMTWRLVKAKIDLMEAEHRAKELTAAPQEPQALPGPSVVEAKFEEDDEVEQEPTGGAGDG